MVNNITNYNNTNDNLWQSYRSLWSLNNVSGSVKTGNQTTTLSNIKVLNKETTTAESDWKIGPDLRQEQI
jgi:hypothetical protein